MTTDRKADEGRDSIINFVGSRLVGPRGGREEVIEGRPFLQYMMGILFGQGTTVDDAEGSVAAGVDDPTPHAGARKEDDRGSDDWLRLVGETLPSAVGISFVVDAGEVIRCQVNAARYEPGARAPDDRKRRRASEETWTRVPLAPEEGETLDLAEGAEPATVLDKRGCVTARWRALGQKRLVTVTLVNQQRQQSGLDPERALFQVQLSCEATKGRVHPYPVPARAYGPVPEEEYLYRSSVPFARGHGVAAEWEVEDEVCRRVMINFMPSVDVPLATFSLPEDAGDFDPRALSVDWLARQDGDPGELRKVLRTFLAAYERWIQREAEAARDNGEAVGEELAAQAAEWARRMSAGIDRLTTDADVRVAFAYANRAMGSQMVLTSYLRQVARAGDNLKSPEPPDMSTFGNREWRPFQMAFFLGVVDGLCDTSAPSRSIADVIWFPTGGGKTEAYLLVAAFELLRRRLADAPAETATAILSRYTLRMLTAQQFQRTAALFVSLETIRLSDEARWGDASFRLGLWVGGGKQGLTPNRLVEAMEKLEEMRSTTGDRKNPFLLTRCPRCGADMFPEGSTSWGVVATEQEFRLFCPNGKCPFRHQLPVDLVDESLYRAPPSMLIGTVDKFAQLPWDERARAFFAGPDGLGTPPSLLIQDELHLISGPLGTLDAGYESAIEEIIKRCGAAQPKIICSTATIKNAAEQVRGLYARTAYVFPAPIRRWDDAFFFRSDPTRTRRYVGIMGQGYTKALMGLVWTSAALMQAVQEAPLTTEERDAFWTLVAYHNSRRELGRTMTAARDEIPTRIKVVASSEANARPVPGQGVMQLSAQMSTSLDRAIRLLETSLGGAEPALDIVPCTSIMSVGIDIDRLGLMLVNGQPKLVAEYIQATSRVGRGATQGLVLTVFSAMKSRDRSHYEDFKGFHQNLYRFVEPTSVTPLAPPARERTLHAALVAIIRHTTEWGANKDAAVVELGGPEVKAIVKAIIARARNIEEELASDVEDELLEILGRWEQHQQPNFVYDRAFAGQQFEPLLSEYGGADRSGFPTMRSLRHVDAEVSVRIETPWGPA